MRKESMVVLTGPTAAGKTGLSVRLAKRIGAEIISADSMQVYRGMDIGTAKIRQDQMEGVPHHLIDILDPGEDFNVMIFKKLALEAAAGIRKRGHIPLLVGGTGFYIRALLYDTDFSDQNSGGSYRAYLNGLAREKGKEYLYKMLLACDPDYAAEVHSNNQKRVVRALEYYHETGECLSAHNRRMRDKESPYHFACFVLTRDRDRLYEQIDRRVDAMMEEGLLDEVSSLAGRGYDRDLVSMQGIGYKEFFDYFDDRASLDQVRETIKKETRHFAKRQLTWFRREKDLCWINKDDYRDEDSILEKMLSVLEEKGIWQNRQQGTK